MMHGSNSVTYSGFWLMFLVGVVLIALIAVGVFIALKAVNSQEVGSVAPTPREVLDLRLARGEITPEEYTNTRPLLDG
jgi:putative membrane protein